MSETVLLQVGFSRKQTLEMHIYLWLPLHGGPKKEAALSRGVQLAMAQFQAPNIIGSSEVRMAPRVVLN